MCITNITLVMLFRKIIVYYGNHSKPANAWRVRNAEQLNVKAGGTYRYHFDLKHLISDPCPLILKETVESVTAEITDL
jgi:hypothetical protein